MSTHVAHGPPLATGNGVVAAAGASALVTCVEIVAAWMVRSGQRRTLRELAEEGRLFRDLGLTHEQALREAGKPFWRR